MTDGALAVEPSPADGRAGEQPAGAPPGSEALAPRGGLPRRQAVAGAQPQTAATAAAAASASSALALVARPAAAAGGPLRGDDPETDRPLDASRLVSLNTLPNEVLLHILGFLDVNDLLSTSRASHHLRCLCIAPILHILRRRRIRATLAPLLSSPSRPSLSELISRSIFLTKTTVVSRQLARSLVSIRLSRRLAARPPVHVLVERSVLPPECAPGIGHVAPALAARARAIEREKLKDGLRRWIGVVWKREVGRRSEHIQKFEESVGIGKVWRLRKFWERVSRGDAS